MAVLVLVGCASSSDSTSSDPTKPGILLVQTSNIPAAARHTDGPLTVHYAMRVENNALATIKLKQVTVQSISEGAYYVAPTSKPFDLPIESKQRQEVEFWVTGRPSGSVVGANGPVTLRVTCVFESATGEKFQHIVMQRVNERASITGQ